MRLSQLPLIWQRHLQLRERSQRVSLQCSQVQRFRLMGEFMHGLRPRSLTSQGACWGLKTVHVICNWISPLAIETVRSGINR